MHVFLIYYAVNMLLCFILCSETNNINDISELCSQGRTVHSYLTSGIGSSDKSVTMIAVENILNCSIKYFVKPKRSIIVVIEFPDLRPDERICVTELNSSVMVSDYTETKNCKKSNIHQVYHKVSKEEVAIHLRNNGQLSTIKVTATSVRDAKSFKCRGLKELECIVDNQIYCMTSETSCDGHTNCGVNGSYDEDRRKCKGPSLVFMIACSILMGMITLYLFASAWMAFFPKRKETFIYKIDRRVSVFDSQSGISSVEIDIQILFPNENAVSKV